MDFSHSIALLTDLFHNDLFLKVAEIITQTSPLWLPIILFQIFWPVWVQYVRAEFFFKQKYNLLEIKLPKETMKSPLAMELFLSSIHQTGGEGSWYSKFWLGMTRPWFSLEMVSIEGKVRFFIWTRSGMKNFIESSLYAQFPGIEINDMDDYSKSVSYDPITMSIWAAEFQLSKPDPYPIKTYVDYGLDKDPKEEFKVDPIAPLIEFLGSVGVNQQVWIQIIVRAHKAEKPKFGMMFKMTDPLKEEAQKIVNEILLRDPKTKVAGTKNESGFPQIPTITKGEQEIVAAIERNMTKHQYDVGIRGLYIAKRDMFNPANITGLTGSWKQFGSESLNGFKPNGDALSPSFSYPWQDFREIRQNRMRQMALESYKRRSFFYPPFTGKAFVLSSEELATIFHFPGQVAQTPTFTRVPSKKAEPPANLPI